MKNSILDTMRTFEVKVRISAGKLREKGMKKEAGIDGILVTVGLCLIALVLCVIMKNNMETFIVGIVKSMTKAAEEILQGVYTGTPAGGGT